MRQYVRGLQPTVGTTQPKESVPFGNGSLLEVCTVAAGAQFQNFEPAVFFSFNDF